MNEFRDIVVPEPVSGWPATWAWAVLLLVLLVAGVAVVRLIIQRRRASRYRRLALLELDDITDRGAWGELPALVKRVALQVWPRVQVASLTGREWIAFLDRSYGSDGFGRTGLYEGDAACAPVVRDWIRSHHA